MMYQSRDRHYFASLSSTFLKHDFCVIPYQFQSEYKEMYILELSVSVNLNFLAFLQHMNYMGTEAEIQLPLKRSSRFQRLFPNPSWLV